MRSKRARPDQARVLDLRAVPPNREALLYEAPRLKYTPVMAKYVSRVALLLGASLLAVACGDSSGNGGCPEGQILCNDVCIDACGVSEVECDCVCIPEFEPTLADIQTNVFAISCTASSCHDAQAPQADLDLSTLEASETNLIDVPSVQVDKDRVVLGDLDASYLYDKLTNTDIPPTFQPMPQGGFPLCDAKLEAVEAWIVEGSD